MCDLESESQNIPSMGRSVTAHTIPFYKQEDRGAERTKVWFWVLQGGKEKQELELKPPDSLALEYFHFTLNEDVLEMLIFSS